VADKGYHSDEVLTRVEEHRVRSHIAEPERGRRVWKGKNKEAEQRRLYANRRRLGGRRGKVLHRKRAELAEQSFAHMYETGGMRRLHLRGRRNILKRLLVHGAGLNLALVMRKRYGVGKPRQLQGRASGRLSALFFAVLKLCARSFRHLQPFRSPSAPTPLPPNQFAPLLPAR